MKLKIWRRRCQLILDSNLRIYVMFSMKSLSKQSMWSLDTHQPYSLPFRFQLQWHKRKIFLNFFQNLHSTKIKTTCSWKIMIICKANDFICQWELIISLGLEVCDVHKKLKKFIYSLSNYYSINNILFKILYLNNVLSNYKRLSMYPNYENTFNKIKKKF